MVISLLSLPVNSVIIVHQVIVIRSANLCNNCCKWLYARFVHKLCTMVVHSQPVLARVLDFPNLKLGSGSLQHFPCLTLAVVFLCINYRQLHIRSRLSLLQMPYKVCTLLYSTVLGHSQRNVTSGLPTAYSIQALSSPDAI
jgi:hypothetical protein